MYPHWISHMNYELVKNKAKKDHFFRKQNPDHFEEGTEAIVIINT